VCVSHFNLSQLKREGQLKKKQVLVQEKKRKKFRRVGGWAIVHKKIGYLIMTVSVTEKKKLRNGHSHDLSQAADVQVEARWSLRKKVHRFSDPFRVGPLCSHLTGTVMQISDWHSQSVMTVTVKKISDSHSQKNIRLTQSKKYPTDTVSQ
jgi:hypothetical protein